MCFDTINLPSPFAKTRHAILFSCIVVGSKCSLHKLLSMFRNQMIVLAAESAATYSALAVLCVKIDCFFEFQSIRWVYTGCWKKKYQFSLSVIFVDDVLSGNRCHFYESFICKFYSAKFRQECRTNSSATDKLKYSQNFDKNPWAKRIVLLITSLFFVQSNQNFQNIQK